MKETPPDTFAPAIQALRNWIQESAQNEALVQFLLEILHRSNNEITQNCDKSILELLLNLDAIDFQIDPVIQDRIERQACGELIPEIPLLLSLIESGQHLKETGKYLNSDFQQIYSAGSTTFERDLRGVECPRNYVKASVILRRIPPGSSLRLLLDEGMPIENVPMRLQGDGYQISERVHHTGYWQIMVYKPEP